MSDETGPPDPPMLDYRPPEPPKGSRYPGVAVGGFLLAAAQHVAWIGVAVFLALAAGGIAGAVLLWLRRPLAAGGWFLAGLLIGLALTGLLEGACYANP